MEIRSTWSVKVMMPLLLIWRGEGREEGGVKEGGVKEGGG